MNYFIIEDIDNPLDKYAIVQSITLTHNQLEDLIAEAKKKAEENGTYDMDELRLLLEKDMSSLFITDFDTMYV